MATLTIRNLDDDIKRALRFRAAKHGVSMEQEARIILKNVVLADGGEEGDKSKDENWYRAIRKLVEPYGGFDLEIPPRSKSLREPPSFE